MTVDHAGRLRLAHGLEIAEREQRTPLPPALAGRVALVTGAARGLGRAYALRLARLGADVVVNDVRLDAAAEFGEELTAPTVADECRASGVRALAIAADVTDKAQVESMVAAARAEFGHVDILVNNAGGALTSWEGSYPSTFSEEDYRYIMDVNLSGTIFCCQAVAPGMKERRWGRIVNVSSSAGGQTGVTAMLSHYAVSKAAISHYTRALAAELGPFGINVNAIAPDQILSSRTIVKHGRADPDNIQRTAATIPLRRLGTPEDCARVVEFLVGDLSGYVSGQIISICGGSVRHPF